MRPSTQEYFLSMAKLVASRGTCYRRQVGCVLVDGRNRVLATGYNGVPSGVPHCNHRNPEAQLGTVAFPQLCKGALAPSGTMLSDCQAVHAEANALISCRHPEDVEVAYCTASPCYQCVGYLLNTNCRSIVFSELYPHPESKDRWVSQGRLWLQFSDSN